MTVRNQIDIRFTRLLSEQIIKAYRQALNKIYGLPLDQMQDIDTVISLIKAEYDQSAVINSDNLYSASKLQYQSAIRQIQAQIRQSVSNFKYQYNRQDRDILNILDQNNTLFVGKYFDNQVEPIIREQMAKIITEQQTKKDTANAIREMMIGQGKSGYGYSKMLVETNGTWARSIGKANAMERAEFKQYQFVATVDDATSDICNEMNGKIFSVESAQNVRDEYLSIDASDYNTAVKQLESFSPFIRQTENGWSAGGRNYSQNDFLNIPGVMMPPLHPNCRSEIEPIGID